MPNYQRPKSSVTRKPVRSSLHPHGAPGFAETIEGLKRGLANLGSHLAGAAVGIAGNLIAQLSGLKKASREGDEDAERAYEEAVAMLRGSGSATADALLKELGEQLDETPGEHGSSPHAEEGESNLNA